MLEFALCGTFSSVSALQPCLGGNACAVLLACVSPACTMDNYNTLVFAEKMRCVKNTVIASRGRPACKVGAGAVVSLRVSMPLASLLCCQVGGDWGKPMMDTVSLSVKCEIQDRLNEHGCDNRIRYKLYIVDAVMKHASASKHSSDI